MPESGEAKSIAHYHRNLNQIEVILYASAHRRRTTAGIMGPTNLSGFVQR
jgi:hypothetical protein